MLVVLIQTYNNMILMIIGTVYIVAFDEVEIGAILIILGLCLGI